MGILRGVGDWIFGPCGDIRAMIPAPGAVNLVGHRHADGFGSTSTGPKRNVGDKAASAVAIHSRRMPISLRGSNAADVACTTQCGSTSNVSATSWLG